MTAPLASSQATEMEFDDARRDRAIYRLAGTAFDLIEKHGTPPSPMTYTMWYAYAAQSPDVVSREVDEILATHGKITGEQIEDVFEAHLSGSYFQDSSERIQ